MLLTLKNQTEVPTEIILLILDHLPKADLKTLSFVCLEFARLTRLPLFRSITVSAQQSDIHRFLNIIRRPQLCCIVERLVWQELPFRNRGSASPEKILSEWPRRILSQHLAIGAGTVLPEDISEAWSPEQAGSEEQAEQLSLEEQEIELINRICSFAEHEDCAIADVDTCMAALTECFKTMPRLRTLISRDTREPGNMMDAILNPPISFDGHQLLPLSDAAMRLMHFHEGGDSWGFMCNNGGFFCMLEALSITGAPVENLITERPQGLLKLGIPPVPPFPSVDLKLGSKKAFKSLRRICLCIDSPDIAVDPVFPQCLEAADQLEHLEISVTYNTLPTSDNRLIALRNRNSFLNLRTLLLELAAFTEEDIIGFLVRRAQSLVHVTLWDCYLTEPGTWTTVIQALAKAEYVRFESFILKSPKDTEINGHLDDSEVAPCVKSEALLRFINEGGTAINPFEQRHWIDLDDYVDTTSHASDYSDISGGTAARWEAEDTADNDPDGPEYHSEYDSDDAPDPETDSEEDQIKPDSKRGTKGAEARFYNEMWEGLGSP